MPKQLPEEVLAVLAKGTKNQLALVRLVAENHPRGAIDVGGLVDVLVADRLALAREHLQSAERALRTRPPQPRVAVSRAYYAMYHAMRSVVFHVRQGDLDDHERLPREAPDDFPSQPTWQNRLKNARLLRNEVDYSPYPRDAKALRGTAGDRVNEANELIGECEQYLRNRGWTDR